MTNSVRKKFNSTCVIICTTAIPTLAIYNLFKYFILDEVLNIAFTTQKTKISAGKTATFQFSNIKSNTEFYIVFEGDSYSFTGYIK